MTKTIIFGYYCLTQNQTEKNKNLCVCMDPYIHTHYRKNVKTSRYAKQSINIIKDNRRPIRYTLLPLGQFQCDWINNKIRLWEKNIKDDEEADDDKHKNWCTICRVGYGLVLLESYVYEERHIMSNRSFCRPY